MIWNSIIMIFLNTYIDTNVQIIINNTIINDHTLTKTNLPVHQFDKVDLEFVSVHFGELFQSESPAVETGAKTY